MKLLHNVLSSIHREIDEINKCKATNAGQNKTKFNRQSLKTFHKLITFIDLFIHTLLQLEKTMYLITGTNKLQHCFEVHINYNKQNN